MEGKCCVDHFGLARLHRRIGARSGSDPIDTPAPEQRRTQRGRNGGIADAKIAKAKQISAAGDGLHAEGHGGGAAALVKRRVLGDVGRRNMQCQIEDLQAEIVGDADLVDRSTTGGAKLDRVGGRRRPAAAKCRGG